MTTSSSIIMDTSTLQAGCNDDKLMSILAALQVIDPENIVQLANNSDLDSFCRKIGVKLKEAYEYIKGCSLMSSQRMYANLIDGVESLYDTVCLDDRYRRAFESHSDCIRNVFSEPDNCAGPKDWVEDCNKTRLCKAYQNIIDCYMIKSALLCGPDAADVFKNLLINVLRATVVTDCGIRTRSASVISKPLMTEKAFYSLHLIIIFCLIFTLICLLIKR